MKKVALLVAILMVVVVVGAVFAQVPVFEDSFNNGFQQTWFVHTFEGGDNQTNVLCQPTACGTFEDDGEKFLRFTLANTQPIYTDNEIRGTQVGTYDNGPWSLTPENPRVRMTCVFRMDASHNQDGSGTAVGTNGCGLWNNGIDFDTGAVPGVYDHLALTWVDDANISYPAGSPVGLGGTAVIDLNLFSTSGHFFAAHPTFPVTLTNWNVGEIIWWLDANGQHVEFFINGTSIGSHNLPVALQGLSPVAWQDNQALTFSGRQLLIPSAPQTFDINHIKVEYMED